MKYRWKFWPNETWATLHLDVRVPPWSSIGNSSATELDPEDMALFVDIGMIHGVTDVYSHDPYQIGVCRGELFDWADIMPEVLAVVAARFSPNAEPVCAGPPIPAGRMVRSPELDFDWR